MNNRGSKAGRAQIVSRRQFLNILAVGSVAGLIIKAGREPLSSLKAVTETRLLMGTIVQLTVVGERQQAQEAVDACMERMAALEGVLSHYQPDSEVSRLNRKGELDNASPALLEVLTAASQVSSASDGAFDITVGPLLDLYRQAQASGGLPSADAIGAALPQVGHHHIHISGKKVWFGQGCMGITLDGIGKGYIVEAGVSELRTLGFTNTLVEAGGDLMASGTRDLGEPWRIGLQSPRVNIEGYQTRLSLQNQAVATSGDYQQSYSSDLRHHHILDPRTGYSSLELASATVVAPQAWLADALATTAMVLGPSRGLSVIDAYEGCRGYLVGKDMQVYQSAPAT